MRAARRAQGIAEFAFVGPVFILVLAALVGFSLVTVNMNVAESAARLGARTGIDALSTVNRELAAQPIVSALRPDDLPFDDWLPAATAPNGRPYMRNPRTGAAYPETVARGFLRRLTYTPGSAADLRAVRLRQGWDWGLLDAPDMQGLLGGVLSAAIRGAQQSTILIGGTGAQVTFRACFLWGDLRGETTRYSCPRGSGTTLVATAQGLGAPGLAGGMARAAMITTPAPRWLRVEIDLAQVDLLGNSFTLRASATERIDRLAPACPIPDTVDEQRRDPCGVVYAG